MSKVNSNLERAYVVLGRFPRRRQDDQHSSLLAMRENLPGAIYDEGHNKSGLTMLSPEEMPKTWVFSWLEGSLERRFFIW